MINIYHLVECAAAGFVAVSPAVIAQGVGRKLARMAWTTAFAATVAGCCAKIAPPHQEVVDACDAGCCTTALDCLALAPGAGDGEIKCDPSGMTSSREAESTKVPRGCYVFKPCDGFPSGCEDGPCKTIAECPLYVCGQTACVDGVCHTTPVPRGVSCQVDMVCDGTFGCVAPPLVPPPAPSH